MLVKTLNNELAKMNGEHVKKSLKDSYIAARKDEEFKKLVSKIPMSEEELMKYTSRLEECVADLKRCQSCPSILECSNTVNGYYYYPTMEESGLTFGYHPCKYQKELNKATKYQENAYYFDIPKEIREASVKDIFPGDKKRADVIRYLSNFAKEYKKNQKGTGLYLHGNFGSGKTYLIAAMLNELAASNVQIAIVYWPELLRDLKASFDDDFREKFQYVKKVSILLLDDLGAENLTPWGRDEILGPILQYRMQEMLPTFVTSNLTMGELEEHLSNTFNKVDAIKAKRIIERIHKLTVDMEMVAKNNRN